MEAPITSPPTLKYNATPKRKPILGKRYIMIYNVFQALGSIICTLQVFAFLEILHVVLGIVKSSLAPTLAQVLGRNHVLLVGLLYCPTVQFHWGVPLMVFFWGISELIRFPYYIAQAYNECPPFLTWLRYNAFIVLYPIGFAAENILWYEMLPIMLEDRIHFLDMPNWFNFSFNYYYFALIWITLTFLLFPKQYLYMFSLRKKKQQQALAEAEDMSRSAKKTK
ncbi:hypothetical protein SAMD00019534_117190 [Acytostelium subglobosum LB1]|uniref:hypothetical protein n=1 Tax=Acytostelium subglobosum LB1 TaxID=1410327 RepID=UPI0006448F27|nr:hypothetical protein SAMD00019534_117190 [Acytostelium subglobosum LB1]GAM28543.1 hypothetical protein SAMD00019534_117190 [Acytostelium subglobosum LB1]|eukprot:XP_012748582.1 hypothetical protein SAMD00019534_117190 [Acytostelium subglobosum LB1]